jgi:hypothetical protein
MTRLLALLAIALAATTASAGFAATLNVSSWHLWAGSQTLTKPGAPCTVTGAAADTFVNQSSPSTTYGGATTLDVLADSNIQKWAFVRFDLSSCGIPSTGGADSATLRLYVANASTRSFTLTLTRVLSAWSNTLSWTGAQSLTYASSATTTASSGTTSGTWVTFTVTGDVDDFIQGLATNNGWYVSASGATQNATKDLIQFASSAAASNKPQLVINYEK